MKPIFLIITVCVLGAAIFLGLKIKNNVGANNSASSSETSVNQNGQTPEEFVPPPPPEKTLEEKTLEKLNETIDYKNSDTRKFALDIANKFPGEHNIKQVCAIYKEIFSKWKYVSDPAGEEYFAKASESITDNLTGDCDDFAILMCATLRTIGFNTRLTTAFGTEGGHAFTEVYLTEEPQKVREQINSQYSNLLQDIFGESEVKEINYRNSIDKEGIWLNLDWTSKYPGGKYFNYNRYTIYNFEDNTYFSGTKDEQ